MKTTWMQAIENNNANNNFAVNFQRSNAVVLLKTFGGTMNTFGRGCECVIMFQSGSISHLKIRPTDEEKKANIFVVCVQNCCPTSVLCACPSHLCVAYAVQNLSTPSSRFFLFPHFHLFVHFSLFSLIHNSS